MWFVGFVLEVLSTLETVSGEPGRAGPGRAPSLSGAVQASVCQCWEFSLQRLKRNPELCVSGAVAGATTCVYRFVFNCLHLTWSELDYERLDSVKSHSSCQGSMLLWTACETLSTFLGIFPFSLFFFSFSFSTSCQVNNWTCYKSINKWI